MTHDECVAYAAKWLGKARRSDVVLPEFFCWNQELADVIGFKQAGNESTLIECKVSRADFLRDKNKPFRAYPKRGMGNLRYYCCPKDVIKEDDLPDKWGLIYIYPTGFVKQVVEPEYQEKNLVAEHHLLLYYARRAVYAGVHQSVLDERMYPKA